MMSAYKSYLSGDHVVGKVTVGTNLERTKNGDIDVATANHGEALGAVEDASARNESDSLLAGVDNVDVDLVLGGVSTHTKNTVLTLNPDLPAFRQE